MAKYSKRADGRYCTTITVTIDGEKKKKTVYGKTVREVDDKVAEIRASSNKGIVVDDRSVTVQEWADMWYNLYKANKSVNTQQMYSVAMNHIVKELGTYRLSDLKKHMLQTLLNKRVEEGHIRSAEIIRLTLKQMIAAAIDEQYIFVDISKGLTVPKSQKSEKKPLSLDEVARIKGSELTVKERAFIYVLLYTGIRKGEALALDWSDVDNKNNKIHINKNLIYAGHRAEVKDSPKTAAGIRSIPIPKELADALNEYKDGEGIVFPQLTAVEKYMTSSSFTKFWNEILKKINLDRKITPHILRHTYATRLYYAGVDIKQAQYLLGHSSIQVTLGIYTHLDNERIEKDIDKLENLY